MKNALDLSLEEWQKYLVSLNEPGYRAAQVWEGLHKHLYHHGDSFSILSSALRQQLEQTYSFNSLRIEREIKSKDNMTHKVSFALEDNNIIETVLMRYDRRNTICVSTQAGCAIGCVFCATGQMGYKRNLSVGEIVEQVYYFARRLQESEQRVTNIVFMGMGEPFHNFPAVMDAIKTLNHPAGFNLGQRRITISTVGIVPGIRKFAAENSQVNLAISLHAANDELRSSLLPINKKYPIAELISACHAYVKATRRRITFEYALIQGENDSIAHAIELAGLLKDMLCHVNVIPLNPTEKYAGRATTQAVSQEFQLVLQQAGIPCTIRLRRGIEISAGCGQLAAETTVI